MNRIKSIAVVVGALVPVAMVCFLVYLCADFFWDVVILRQF